MKKRIFTNLGFLFFIITFALVYIRIRFDDLLPDTVLFDAITAITAVFGVFSLVYQGDRSDKLDASQFIVELNMKYIEDDSYQNLISVLEKDDESLITEEYVDKAIKHFDFFEPMYILASKKILKIEMIDDLFCYRFFTVANNKSIQKLVINPHVDYYTNIIKLHNIWEKHRLKYGKAIPYSETDLSKQPWYDEVVNDKPITKHSDNKTVTEHRELDNLTVRQAEPKDSREIKKLYDMLLGENPETDGFEKCIDEIKKSEDNYIYVACADDKVIGTIQCTLCKSPAFGCRPHMVIEYFIVDDSYRNYGVGTKLFNACVDKAHEKQASCVLIVSGNNRKEAHRFYEKMGCSTDVRGFRIDL